MRRLRMMAAALVALAALAAAPEPDVLYRLEFDDGKAPGMNLQGRPMSKWTFEQGALVQENLDERLAVLYNLGHHSWSDFEVRTRIRFLRPRVDPKRGAMFALKVWDCRVDALPGAISIWYKKPGETKSSGVHKHDKAVVIDPNHWYDLRIAYRPGRITVRIDGDVIAELTEAPPRPTRGRPLTIYFGNLKCAMDYLRVVDLEPVGK